MKNRAFTLIELLVVVLIIGILAAIALPKYQTAVAKAHFSQALIWAKNIRAAEQVYKMETGTYTTDLSDLGIVLDGCEKQGTPSNTEDANYVCNKDYRVRVTPNTNIKKAASVYVYLPKKIAEVEFYFYNDTRLCFASTTNERGTKLCKSMGGTPLPAAAGYYMLP